MASKSYALEAGEKASQVMIGTPHTLVWGDLVTKQQISVTGFINTLAEDFVALNDAKVLFLAPTQQMAPVDRRAAYVKLDEILLFFEMSSGETPPPETEVRRYEQVEAIVGSFQVEASILKSPIANLLTMLIVSKDPYMPLYKATIRHVAKPWLGGITAEAVMVRRNRLTMTLR